MSQTGGYVCFSFDKVREKLADIKIDKDDVIVDLGAHVGIVSVYFSKKFPEAKIYSVDPDRENFHNLQRNCVEAGCQNVSFANVAISADSRELTFFHCNSNSGASTIFKHPKSSFEFKAESCTFEDFKKANQIDKIKLLKIDIEGMEYEVIKTIDLTKVDYLMVDLHEITGLPISESQELMKKFKDYVYQFIPQEKVFFDT